MPARAGLRLAAGLAAALILGGVCAPAVRADHAEFVGRIGISKTSGINGLSGLELTEDGTGVTAVIDRGLFVTGRITRRDGVPVRFDPDLPPVAMKTQFDRPARGDQRDAEGLAIDGFGRTYVSFELLHRFRVYSDLAGPARRMPGLSDVSGLGSNRGIEALAVGPDEALYALPEALRVTGRIPVYRFGLPRPVTGPDGHQHDSYDDRRWEVAFWVPAEGRFDPVGADFGPDGRFYLLERAVVAPIGFRSRVRRFTIGADGAGDETVLLESTLGRHGNLEGLAVWRDAAGAIRLTMVADNNGLALQRNEIVEYRVVTGPAGG